MRLRDFLAPERAIVPLPASTVEEGTALLLDRVLAARGVLDAAVLRRRVLESRPEDVVAMGDRAFLVHERTNAVGQLLVAIGVAAGPMCRAGGDDGCRARVLILVVTPPRHAARYLQVVGAFARLLRNAEGMAELLAAESPEGLVGLEQFAASQLPEQLSVRDVMSDQPRTIRPDAPLGDAARTLVRTGLGALPVVDDEHRVIGMVSEREVIRHLLSTQAFQGTERTVALPPGAGGKTVRDVMTRQVLCVAPQQPIAEVASLMSNKDVDRVPVVREGRLVGFLTRGDIVRKLIGS